MSNIKKTRSEILARIVDRLPVQCPKCFVILLRKPENLKENCGVCGKDVQYIKL
jgi:hypothetical protein